MKKEELEQSLTELLRNNGFQLEPESFPVEIVSQYQHTDNPLIFHVKAEMYLRLDEPIDHMITPIYSGTPGHATKHKDILYLREERLRELLEIVGYEVVAQQGKQVIIRRKPS